jgi:hypothetical protein
MRFLKFVFIIFLFSISVLADVDLLVVAHQGNGPKVILPKKTLERAFAVFRFICSAVAFSSGSWAYPHGFYCQYDVGYEARGGKNHSQSEYVY